MDLPRNEFKRQLTRPGVTYGLFSGLVDPAAAEVIAAMAATDGCRGILAYAEALSDL